jgi:hypothetical protein
MGARGAPTGHRSMRDGDRRARTDALDEDPSTRRR